MRDFRAAHNHLKTKLARNLKEEKLVFLIVFFSQTYAPVIIYLTQGERERNKAEFEDFERGSFTTACYQVTEIHYNLL